MSAKIKLLIPVIIIMGVVTTFKGQSYTFTPAGATGVTGPTQSQVNSGYSLTNLNGSVSVLGYGIQTFTIPVTGVYRLHAYGAQGGYNGGSGAYVAGNFTLTSGTVMKLCVGQTGTQATNSYTKTAGGGGGGTFIANLANNLYLVAGGGGGYGEGYAGTSVVCCIPELDASLSTTAHSFPGGSNGGINGGGGTCGSLSAGSGAGAVGNGLQCGGALGNAFAFTHVSSGGYGGTGSSGSGNGGFGGGGGGYNSTVGNRGGGGGGYSGGGGGDASIGTETSAVGGGGGSYNGGVQQLNTLSSIPGDGKAIIEYTCVVSIFASSSNSLQPRLCSGNSVTLTTDAVSNYSWSGGQTSNSVVVSPTVTTTYSLTGTSQYGCSNTGIITVEVDQTIPVLTVTTAGSPSICLGNTISLTAGGALSYTLSNNLPNGAVFSPTSSSTYTITGENACGTSTALESITVSPLSVGMSTTPVIACAGQATTLSVISSATSYSWLPVNATTTAGNVIVYPPNNTTYTVIATDGTCVGQAVMNVSVNPVPTINIVPTSFTIICEGDTAKLTANGALSYTWSTGAIGNSVVLSPNVGGLHFVSGNNQYGCESITYYPITVKPSPASLSVTATKTIVCPGGASTLIAAGMPSYSWSNGPGAPSTTVNPMTTTIYTVTGTHTSGCQRTKTITVNVFNPPVSISPSSTAICKGEFVTLVSGTASSYSWNGTSGLSFFHATPAINATYTLTIESYSITLNCTASAVASVTVNENPVVGIISTKTVLCKNDAPAILTATGAVSYSWAYVSSGNTNSIVSNVNQSMNYSVTGTNADQCSSTATISITVKECTGEEELLDGDDILIYPNPTNGEIILTFNLKDNINDLKIFNDFGQEIMFNKPDIIPGENRITFELPREKGVYLIWIRASNSSTVKKIIRK